MKGKRLFDASDFHPPDYAGGGIVNLLSSIIRSRGGRSPYPELKVLPARKLRNSPRVVYLVIDGLGVEQLNEYMAARGRGGFFSRHPFLPLTTVCPATTAAAVTTFATGAAPSAHGILGWHMQLPDLGLVGTILPAVTRTGVPMAKTEFALGSYLALPTHLASARGRRVLMSWKHIPFSRYSMAAGGWTQRVAFSTLEGLVRRIVAFARGNGRGVAYAYWPEYDSLCHEHGTRAPNTLRHLAAIERVLEGLERRLRGTRTALLITADHGLDDLKPGGGIDLRAVPGLYDTLAVMPSGDARQAHLFVRPFKVEAFLLLVRRCLSRAAVCVRGEEMIRQGWFGPAPYHAALRGRVGDFVLLARPGYAFTATLPGDAADFHAANHGGLSPRELMVPLIGIADCRFAICPDPRTLPPQPV